MEAKESLNQQDIQYLKKHQLDYALNIFEQQETEKKEVFFQLKEKYQVLNYPDTSIFNPLYTILQKIDTQLIPSDSEIKWILDNQLESVHFALLKIKYKATAFEDLSPKSNFYKILKKLGQDNFLLLESDVNFLKKRKLDAVINYYIKSYTNQLIDKIERQGNITIEEMNWLKQNTEESVIILAQDKHFSHLKRKYEVSDYPDNSLSSPLYPILRKLEGGLRLDAIDVAWLQETKFNLFSNKIYLVYHIIEAKYYEEEYQRTGNKWSIPNASSHWRKARQPKQALKLTESINIEQIQDNKLKSAILTTKGGSYRDLEQYKQAKVCAKKAMEYQPDSHHLYTLMGAICYATRRLAEGNYWFEKAIERGASPRDIDAELKRVIEKAKGKDRENVISYLLKKDKQRYAWVKKYLPKSNKGDK